MAISTTQLQPWMAKDKDDKISIKEDVADVTPRLFAPSSPKNKPLFLKLKPDLSPREKRQAPSPKRATYKIHGVNILNRSSIDSITAIERFQRRRESHKKSERRRSQNINAAIAELAELVPDGAPVDKGGILRFAVEHIKDLHLENGTLKMRLQEMEQQQPVAVPVTPSSLNQRFTDPSPPPYLEPSPPLPPILPACTALSPIHRPVQSTRYPAPPQQQRARSQPLRWLGGHQPSSFLSSAAGRIELAPVIPSLPRSMPAHHDHALASPTTSFGQQLQSMIPFSVDGMGWVYVPVKRLKTVGGGD